MKKMLLGFTAFVLLAGTGLAVASRGNELAYFGISELVAITALDPAADYIPVYDASAGVVRKVLATASPNALVTLGATEALTSANANKTLCFGSAAGTATLPAATGSGLLYRFTACAVPPGAGYVITVTGDDTIDGQFVSTQDSGDTLVGWETAANTDTITFTSSTKGSAAIGAWVEVQDIAADQWTVRGQGTSTGSEATPFSGS